MRCIKKGKLLCVFGMVLGLILLAGSLAYPAQTVYADGKINRGQRTDTYASHGRIEDSFSFSVKGDSLIVESVPKELVSKAKNIKITVYRAGRWENNQFVFETYDKSDSYYADNVSIPHTLTFPKEDGVYNCAVSVAFTDGSSESFNQHFTVEDGKAFFSLSVNYDANREIYVKNHMCDTILWFFARPWYEDDKDKAAKIKETAEKIASKGDSDYEKIRKVHDWVSSNIWYDYDFYRKKTDSTQFDPVYVLESKKTVCEGYADLTQALLCFLGIPTRTVSGIAAGQSGWESHAWNEAYADGRWIIVDTTWDSENKYEDGTFSKASPCKRKYFDMTLEEFSETHCYRSSEWDIENEYMQIEFALQGSLSVSATDLLLKKGKAKRIFVKSSEKGINLKDLKITYSSNNKKVASVNKNGKVRGKGVGTAVIKTKVKMKETGRSIIVYDTKVTVRN